MKKALLILPFIFLLGCHSEGHNLNLSAIDQQIIILRNHIYDISDSQGVYQNENIDQQLLQEVKKNVMEKGSDNLEQYTDGKLSTEKKDETLKKMLSVLYFVWMEELDSAQSADDEQRLINLQEEHEINTSSQIIQDYWRTTNKINDYANVREIFKMIPNLIQMRAEIESQNKELELIKNELEELKMTNRISDYNDKVQIYNAKVEENEKNIAEYNEGIAEYNNEYVYSSFIKLIDISTLFPTQDVIELTK